MISLILYLLMGLNILLPIVKNAQVSIERPMSWLNVRLKVIENQTHVDKILNYSLIINDIRLVVARPVCSRYLEF